MFYLAMAVAIRNAQRAIDQEKRNKEKIRIIRANTVHAGVTVAKPHPSKPFFRLMRSERCRLHDYIEELRVQAKWNDKDA